MAEDKSVTCLADVGAVLGEGPVWVMREQALYWVDIPEKRVFRWSEAEGASAFEASAPVCSLAPRASGGFIGAGHDGFVAVDFPVGGVSLEVLVNPEPDLPGNRFNDGKVDREGRFWAGTMDRREQAASGSLYRLGVDLAPVRVDSGYRVTNGPAFSLDGRTMYHNDSALQTIYAFDLAEDGGASDKRVFARFAEGEGYPDGMTVDAEGCLWVAFWDGWCLRRLSPDGAVVAETAMPVQRPTSCAFGGPGLRRLFVTSARRGLDEAALADQPSAGGLLVLEPGVAGVAEMPFAG
jgi:D-xylonolactonase